MWWVHRYKFVNVTITELCETLLILVPDPLFFLFNLFVANQWKMAVASLFTFASLTDGRTVRDLPKQHREKKGSYLILLLIRCCSIYFLYLFERFLHLVWRVRLNIDLLTEGRSARDLRGTQAAPSKKKMTNCWQLVRNENTDTRYPRHRT